MLCHHFLLKVYMVSTSSGSFSPLVVRMVETFRVMHEFGFTGTGDGSTNDTVNYGGCR